MGRGDAYEHKQFGDIVAICDVDKEHADKVNAEEGSHPARLMSMVIIERSLSVRISML